MKNYNLPHSIAEELPKKISEKLRGGCGLEESEIGIIKSCLEAIVVHPENAASSQEQYSSLISLFLDVGAELSQRSVDMATRNIDSPELIKRLNSYDRVISENKIVISKSPISTSSFINYSVVNADRGLRNWNFYAENYHKLIKTVSRWVSLESPFISPEVVYSIYVDGFKLATIEKGKLLIPSLGDDLDSFIQESFGLPLELRVDFDFSLQPNSRFGSYTTGNMVCSVIEYGYEKKLTTVIPESDQLKLSMIKDKVASYTIDAIRELRFKESIRADLKVNVFFKGKKIGLVGYADNEPSFNKSFDGILCGVFNISGIASKCNESEIIEENKKGLFRRIFGM